MLPHPRPSRWSVVLLAPILLGGVPGAAGAQPEDEPDFVAYPCPIEGQKNAVVLGRDDSFQSACMSLSKPREPGPWSEADAGRITGSARFCPRPVLALLDPEGTVTVRFLPLAE